MSRQAASCQVAIVGLSLLAAASAGAQYDPAKAYREAAPVAARYPEPATRYATPGLATERQDFTSHAEMMAFIEGVAGRGGPVALKIVGRSQQGRDIPVLVFGEPRPDRPTILVIGQQHGDEPAGGEAMLALADRLGAGGPLASLLDRVAVVIVPRANIDGAAAHRRVSASGIDVNRDHLLQRTPEGQALGKLFRDYAPNVVLDCHEFTVGARWIDKFGGLQRPDALIQYATTANLPGEFRDLQEMFRGRVLGDLDRAGLTHDWYYTTGRAGGPPTVSMGGIGADTGRNVAALRHAVSFLIETRGVGIGRAHFARRVHTHVTMAEALIRAAADNPGPILEAVRKSRAAVIGQGGAGDFVVLSKQRAEKRVLTFVDPGTGADKPVEVAWNSALDIDAELTRPRPAGYLLAASEADAARRLRDLGVTVEVVTKAERLPGQSYRVTAMREAPKDDVTGADEGAGQILLGDYALEAGEVAVAEGAFYVATRQALANLVGAVLEPENPVGFVANRVVAITDGRVPGIVRLSREPAQRRSFAD